MRAGLPLLLLFLLGAGPAARSGRPGGDARVEQLHQRAVDLERQARAEVHAEGCAGIDRCALAGLGERPCGGPRAYVAYCKDTTDEPKLKRLLEAQRQAERAYQQAGHVMGICSLARRPQLRWVAGRCEAR